MNPTFPMRCKRWMGCLSSWSRPACRARAGDALGFSQGACLSLEYAARHARRYAGVAGLSGGLIGPPDTPRDYPGSLDGTPIFLGCSDIDPHIPKERVYETAQVLERMGAQVTTRIYPAWVTPSTKASWFFVRRMFPEYKDIFINL